MWDKFKRVAGEIAGVASTKGAEIAIIAIPAVVATYEAYRFGLLSYWLMGAMTVLGGVVLANHLHRHHTKAAAAASTINRGPKHTLIDSLHNAFGTQTKKVYVLGAAALFVSSLAIIAFDEHPELAKGLPWNTTNTPECTLDLIGTRTSCWEKLPKGTAYLLSEQTDMPKEFNANTVVVFKRMQDSEWSQVFVPRLDNKKSDADYNALVRTAKLIDAALGS